MVVKRNFEKLYRREEDPWEIGQADSERYGTYLEAIRAITPPGGFLSALDLGCGKGAFTTRLSGLTRKLTGVDVSEIAIAKAFTSNACQRAGATAHQLHGGMGVDLDNDLHFYFERAKAMELKFGASPFHLKALEVELGM